MNPSEPHSDESAALPAELVNAAPTAPQPRLRRAEREQLIPAMRLEDLLTSDHQARVVWQFVQGMALTALDARIRAVEGGPGPSPVKANADKPRPTSARHASVRSASARPWSACPSWRPRKRPPTRKKLGVRRPTRRPP